MLANDLIGKLYTGNAGLLVPGQQPQGPVKPAGFISSDAGVWYAGRENLVNNSDAGDTGEGILIVNGAHGKCIQTNGAVAFANSTAGFWRNSVPAYSLYILVEMETSAGSTFVFSLGGTTNGILVKRAGANEDLSVYHYTSLGTDIITDSSSYHADYFVNGNLLAICVVYDGTNYTLISRNITKDLSFTKTTTLLAPQANVTNPQLGHASTICNFYGLVLDRSAWPIEQAEQLVFGDNPYGFLDFAGPQWMSTAAAAGVTLTVQESLHTLSADSPVLTQAHNLTAAGSTMSFTADSPAITQAHSLTVTDGTMSILADSPALTQGHNLAVADSTHSITADSPALTQAYLLSVAESLLSVSADSPTLIQQHSLAVAESLLSLSADSPTLTTAGALAVASAVMSVAAESPGLVQNHTLVAAQSLLSMAADSPALTQVHSLIVSDGALTLGADSPVLTQAHSLLVADGLLTINADNVDILTAGFLNVQGADLSMLADAPVLTQVHALVVADALHSLTADSPLIGIHLIVPDSTLSVTADSPTLSAETILAVQDALMSLAADGVTLTQVHGLVVSDSLHSMLAGIPSLNEEGAPQSADRIIIVESYGKYILVARENRTIMVQ